jgi:ADP-ribose pyrophosphatase YjhB (NUDIX family)
MTTRPIFGAALDAKPSSPNAVVHPQAGDDGKPFMIYSPSKASAPESWSDPAAVAVCVPGGAMPAVLNGVAFVPWDDHPKTVEGWEYVDGQMLDLDEPDMVTNGKAPAAGVIIEEPDGRIWLVNPSNGFAGYKTTFPKGHADDGISLQATAIKEAFEESGLQVEIIGLHGDVERGQTMTRYYRARRVGGTPAAMGWETQAVQLVPKSYVHAAVNRDVDRKVATLAGIKVPSVHLAALKAKPHLGNVDVVSGLVRELFKGVCDRVVDANTGVMTGAQAAAKDQKECVRLAAIFLGRDPDYETMGQWNDGGGLSSFMLEQLAHVYASPADRAARDKIVADLIAWAVKFAYEAITAHAEDDEPDGLQEDLVNLSDDLTHFLLGVPGKFAGRLYL